MELLSVETQVFLDTYISPLELNVEGANQSPHLLLFLLANQSTSQRRSLPFWGSSASVLTLARMNDSVRTHEDDITRILTGGLIGGKEYGTIRCYEGRGGSSYVILLGRFLSFQSLWRTRTSLE